MSDPRTLISKLYWDVFFEYNGERLFLARAILWNMMYHLDYQYGAYPRVKSFNQEWATHKSDVRIP